VALTASGQQSAELHVLSTRRTAAGVHAVCRCGAWEGWWNGEPARLYVLDDFDHHRRASSNGGNTPPVQ
jgi:hypothetical protein